MQIKDAGKAAKWTEELVLNGNSSDTMAIEVINKQRNIPIGSCTYNLGSIMTSLGLLIPVELALKQVKGEKGKIKFTVFAKEVDGPPASIPSTSACIASSAPVQSAPLKHDSVPTKSSNPPADPSTVSGKVLERKHDDTEPLSSEESMANTSTDQKAELKVARLDSRKQQAAETNQYLAQGTAEVVPVGPAPREVARNTNAAVQKVRRVMIKVTGIQAKDMPETESALTSLWDKQDPYVRVLIGGESRETQPVRHKAFP